jgi:hypothetical protein
MEVYAGNLRTLLSMNMAICMEQDWQHIVSEGRHAKILR